jgi:general stress protein 26
MEFEIIENRSEAIDKLKDLLQDVNICMFITTDDNGKVMSRPMATVDTDDEGNVWFFTNEFSEKIHEASQDNSVALAYSHPGKNVYVHINGVSTVIVDKAKMKELWTPLVKAWFPDGVDDPKLCLIKVNVQEAHYWNSASNKMVTFFNMVKSIATGDRYDEGEVGKLKFGKK